MIVTESDARGKLCKIGGPSETAINVYASSAQSFSAQSSYHRFGTCEASNCMHWEYLFRQDEVSALADEERQRHPPYGRGFCGAVKSKLMVI